MLSLRVIALFCIVHSISDTDALKAEREEIDKVIEDEITEKLSVDLLQSIERKFEVDLERSVDMVLMKIKLLLQNGTLHIQEKMAELQSALGEMKQHDERELEKCFLQKQNETSALAEKALHQMVICGYALIGHDPAQAVTSVLNMKEMIRQGVQPINEQRREVYNLLKVCGHDHESLKKVIKCVISKSPIIKTAMMEVTGRLIEGVIDLTKLLAHGAMHEACLIEVIKTVEDEAFELLKKVKRCTYENETLEEVEAYLKQDNATILDINKKVVNDDKPKILGKKEDVIEMKDLIRRMLSYNQGQELDKKFKKKLEKLQKDLGAIGEKDISSNIIV